MHKKFFFTMLIALYLTSIFSAYASAEGFRIGYKIISDKANVFEPAIFEVSIQNLRTVSDSYRLYFINDPRWSIQTEPLSDRLTGMDIDATSTKITTLRIMPITPMSYGRYNIVMTAKSITTGEEQSMILPVFVTAVPYGKQYALTVVLGADVPENVDPRQPMKIRVSVENKMPTKRSGLKIKVSDEIGLFSEESTVELDALEKKNFDFIIKIDPAQQPAEDSAIIKLFTSDDILIRALDKKPFTILPYSSIEESETVKKLFLRSDTVIKVRNSGNAFGSYIIKRRVGFFENLFLRTTPKAKWMKVNDTRYLVWQVELGAHQESQVVMIKTYRGFALLLIAIAILIGMYYNIRNPIVIKKRAGITKMKEGGISELKVQLSIRNRTAKSIEGVRLVDTVPDIADVEKNFEAGTLKPDSITKHAVKGTLIKWDLGTLDRLEERLISYRIRAKLSIIGYFTLPPAVVKYIYRKKESIIKSNKVMLEVAENPEE